ncbi:MAG: radical SAM protein [Candidatus Woesearchaeota archaeon]
MPPRRDLQPLLEQAQKAYQDSFDGDAWFGRCIFLSFYCERGTCTFCFRSVAKHQRRHARKARRSLASILTEALLIRAFNWRIEFLTGGYGILDDEELLRTIKLTSQALGRKLWVNLGAIPKDLLERMTPYVEGVVSSIETMNPALHEQVCPDKPIEPYEEMMSEAKKLGLKNGMTLIIGLGEREEDFPLLEEFIKKHGIERITFYALRPVKGTPHTKGPTREQVTWWVAKTRAAFPHIEIIAGTAEYRLDETPLLLEAGANALTKLPATKMFNTAKAEELERLVESTGRKWTSTISHDDPAQAAEWDAWIRNIDLTADEEATLKRTLDDYLERMRKKKEKKF